jgi:membrane protease YdiL (CAAX protease family)
LRARGRGWGEVFGLKGRRLGADFVRGVLAYLAMVPFFLFYTALYQWCLHALGYELEMQEVIRVLTAEAAPWLRFYLFFLAVAVAPFAEEVLVRGVGLPLLARKVGVAPAMILISLLFAGIHAHLVSLVPLFVVSLSLCVAYVCTQSLLVPAVMHGVFNAVNLCMLVMAR